MLYRGYLDSKYTKFAFRLLVLLVPLLLVVRSSAAQENDSDVILLKSDEKHYDWALDSDTGRVFASAMEGTEIIEYSATMQTEVRRFDLGNIPRRLLVKNTFLVTTCKSKPVLKLVDLRADQVVGQIELSVKEITDIGAKPGAANRIYASAIPEESGGEAVIFEIDLRERKVVHTFKEGPGNRDMIRNFSVSNSGESLLLDRRGRVSPSGATFARLNRKANTFERVTHLHDSFAVPQAGPTDRSWFLGSSLVSFDELKPTRKLSGQMVSIHRELNLVATLDVITRRVELLRFSNGKRLANWVLPELDTEVKSRTRRWYYNRDVDDPVLEFDYKNKALFCAMRTTAFLIPIGEITKDVEPMVQIRSPRESTIKVGNKMVIDLEMSNPKLNSTAEFNLESGPSSASLNGRTLSWTPGNADVGTHQFLITTESNGVKDTFDWSVSVKGNELDLELSVYNWSISPSGKYALVWGRKVDKTRRYPSGSQSDPTTLRLVNLDDGSIQLTAEYDKRVLTAAVDDSHIFLITQNSNVLHRHNIDDFEKKSRVFLPGTGTGLAATTDQKILVFYQLNQSNLMSNQQGIFDPESLKLQTGDPRTGACNTSQALYAPLSSGKATDGRHIYTQSGEVQTVLQLVNVGFPLVSQDAYRNYSRGYGGQPSVKYWGRSYDGSTLRDGKGNQICRIQPMFAISPDYPLGVGLKSSSKSEGRKTTTLGELTFYDLIEGAELGKQVLYKSTSRSGSYPTPYSSSIQRIQFRGKMCHLIFNGKLYSAEIPAEILKSTKTPLEIKYPEQLKVDLSKPSAEITFACPGHEGASFELLNKIPGIALSPSGKLSIDTASIWKKQLAQVSSSSSFGRRSPYDRRSNTNQTFEKESRRRYQIADKETAILIPLAITATGKDGQSDRITCNLIGIGNKSELEEKKQELVQLQMERQKQAAEERAKRAAAMEKQREQSRREMEQNQNQKENSEVNELKLKIRRLESVIDSLIDRIEKLEGKK